MKPKFDIAATREAMHKIAAGLALISLLVALAVLVLGWGLGIDGIVRLRATYPAMVPETALLLIAGSVGTLLQALRLAHPLVVLLGWVILGIMAMGTLSPFVPTAAQPDDAMSFATSITASIIGLGLILSDRDRSQRNLLRATLITVGLSLVSLPLLGYLFAAEALFSNPVYTAMALHTAACSFLILAALTLLEPRGSWVAVILAPEHGSELTRRILPLIVAGPIFLCALAKIATDINVMEPDFRLAMLAFAMIVSTGGATLFFANIVNIAERRTNAIERQLRLSEMTRQKTELAIARSQKVEALGQLVGGVAHDFNNTLTVVLGNLDLIVQSGNEDERKQYTLEAMQAAELAANHTRQLLAYVRKSRLQPSPQNLADLIGPTLLMFRRLRPANIEIHTEIDESAFQVLVDPVNFQQSLLNLLINARDALPRGGHITVALRPEHSATMTGALSDSAELAPGTYMGVAVIDTGVGMDVRALERATEPFFTTKEVGEGSGLGLSMVSGFCRQSGGGLRIKSSLGEGSEVTMLFPVTDAPRQTEPAMPQSRTHRSDDKANIMIVEDEPQVSRVLARQLEADGHSVQLALDSEEAQGLLVSNELLPDLILTDLIMPGRIQGHELAQWVRETYPSISVALMSGYESENERRQYPAVADLPFVQKPIDRERLRAIVAEAIGKRDKAD
jgi:signal transduction histidine kinase/CheY-like chemotaxis protein